MMLNCRYCGRSGVLRGGGCIDVKCHQCNGTGKLDTTYIEAIEKIKALDETISEDEAKQMFTDELKKINAKDSEDGKSKWNFRPFKRARKNG